MSLSVQTTNLVSEITFVTAIEASCSCLAAAVLHSPIGALGGALFGAARRITSIPLHMLTKKILNTDNPQASTTAKIVAKAIAILGSLAAAWGLLSLAGFPLALENVVILELVSSICIYSIALCTDNFESLQP